MPDTNRPRLMDVVEKFVTTVLTADAFGLVGLFVARNYQQVKGEPSILADAITWGTLGVMFVIVVALNAWAAIRAGRELAAWQRNAASRWRAPGADLILLLLGFAAAGVGVQMVLIAVESPL